jgi:hypothetical protein
LVDFDDSTIQIPQGNSNSFHRYSNDHQRIDSSRAAQPSMMQHMYNGFASVASAVSNFSRSTACDTSQTYSGRRIQNEKDYLLQSLDKESGRIGIDTVSSSSSYNPSRVTKAMDQEGGSEGEAEFDFGNGRVTDKAPGTGLTGTHTHFGGDSVNRTENVIVIDSDDEGATTHEGSHLASASRQPSVSNTNNGIEKYEVFNDEETQLAEPGPGLAFKDDSISYLQIADNGDDNNNNNNSYNSSNDFYHGPRSEESSNDGCGTVEVIDGNMMKGPADRRHSQRGDDSSGDEVEVIKTVTRKPMQTMCSLQATSSSQSNGLYPEPDESRDGLRRSTNSAIKRHISEKFIDEEDDEDRYNQKAPPKKRRSGSQGPREFDDFIVDSDVEEEEDEDSEYEQSDSDKPQKKGKEKAAKKSRCSSGKKTGQQKNARAATPDSSVRVMSTTVSGTVDLTAGDH